MNENELKKIDIENILSYKDINDMVKFVEERKKHEVELLEKLVGDYIKNDKENKNE